MREDAAKAQLLGQISVKRHLVALAKQMILGRPWGSQVQFQELVDSFMRQQAVAKLDHVNLNERADPETDLRCAAKTITCELVVAKAVAELIGQGRLMFHSQMRYRSPYQGHTTVLGNSGGSTGGFQLEELSYSAPDHLIVSVGAGNQDAFEPDIFVLEAGVTTADSGVQGALKDAAACLAHDLYRPAAAMLGSAVEGAWIELGLALADGLEGSGFDSASFREEMKADQPGIAKKMADILAEYDKTELVRQIRRRAGVSAAQLRTAYIWSDEVREARNAIHFNNPGTLGSVVKIT
jgi:hypothetical protein